MEKQLRFAVIGTNFISDRFVDAVSKTDGVCVSAVLSRTMAHADAFADKYGIENRFDNLMGALSLDCFDALYIATPNYTHKEIAIAALKAGKHVLCEKIIADSTADFLEMKAAAQAKGLVLLEAMRPDFDPAYDVLRAAMKKLGKIRRVSFEYDQYSSRYDAFRRGEVLPAFDSAIGNNALADIGIYPLHMALSLFGKPKDVLALPLTLSNGFHAAGSILMHTGDLQTTVSVTYSKITSSVTPSVIEGEDGALTFAPVNAPTFVTFTPRGGAPEVLYSSDVSNNMIYEVAAFRDMVNGKRDASAFLTVTEETLQVYDEVKKSF